MARGVPASRPGPVSEGGTAAAVDRPGDAPAVPAWAGALAGAIAGAVGVAVSELVAGLLRGVPSLVVAVGSLVIALQPPGAKDLMASLFGTNDKLALNVAVVVVALVAAAVGGHLARRRFGEGAAIFALFGLLAAVAGARQPLTPWPASLANAALGTGVSLGALGWLLAIARPGPGRHATAAITVGSAPIAARPPAAAGSTGLSDPEWSRRRFLLASAVAVGGAAIGGGIGRNLVDARHVEGIVTTSRLPRALQPVAPLSADESLTVPGITPIVVPSDQFYRIDTALLVPQVDVATWTLQVRGMVDHPLTFTYDELLNMPLIEQYVTVACVSNRVGEHLVGNALWTGVRLKEVLAAAGVQAGATQVVGRSVDDFTVGFPTAWAMAPERESMIVLGMNREPLPAEHGFPARLIVPGLYGYVSATKWLSAIELTTREAVDGYWIPLGWAKDGPILTQSRIDVPANGDSVPAGTATVAGIAWAPDRGITKVAVRIDDGAWQPATISRPISKATWVQWELPWSATSGQHRIEVRATDGTGDVQTADASDSAPDGARGHHRITVTVG